MARMGFIQDEMDLKLLVLYIMARIAAPITFLQLLSWHCATPGWTISP